MFSYKLGFSSQAEPWCVFRKKKTHSFSAVVSKESAVVYSGVFLWGSVFISSNWEQRVDQIWSPYHFLHAPGLFRLSGMWREFTPSVQKGWMTWIDIDFMMKAWRGLRRIRLNNWQTFTHCIASALSWLPSGHQEPYLRLIHSLCWLLQTTDVSLYWKREVNCSRLLEFLVRKSVLCEVHSKNYLFVIL